MDVNSFLLLNKNFCFAFSVVSRENINCFLAKCRRSSLCIFSVICLHRRQFAAVVVVVVDNKSSRTSTYTG